MEIKCGMTDGYTYSYLGNKPEEGRNIIFFFGSRIDTRYYPNVIKSAVEAVRHGYDIVTNGRYKARRALSFPVLAAEGRMHVVFSPSLSNVRISLEEQYVLLSGGSFISFTDSKTDDGESLIENSVKMLSFSDKIIFIGRAVPYLAREALDRGMEIALLRDFLYDRDTRRLALEGASVIDTFSSWLTEPRHIAYEEIREGKCILRMMDY